jgi:hypothetical protein
VLDNYEIIYNSYSEEYVQQTAARRTCDNINAKLVGYEEGRLF